MPNAAYALLTGGDSLADPYQPRSAKVRQSKTQVLGLFYSLFVFVEPGSKPFGFRLSFSAEATRLISAQASRQ